LKLLALLRLIGSDDHGEIKSSAGKRRKLEINPLLDKKVADREFVRFTMHVISEN